jgi:hypothetical protein
MFTCLTPLPPYDVPSLVRVSNAPFDAVAISEAANVPVEVLDSGMPAGLIAFAGLAVAITRPRT